MRARTIAAVLAATTALAWPAPGALQPSDCDAALAAATGLNSIALLDRITACTDEDRIGDANYLFALAQMRGTADLFLFKPVNELDEAVYEVSLWLYYSSSSVGFDEFYRSPEDVAALEQRIRSTDLTLDNGYDPGWAYRPSTKLDLYPDLIAEIREQHLWTRAYVALLMQDDEYYAAFTARLDLMEQNRDPGAPENTDALVNLRQGLEPGTAAYEEYFRILDRQREAAANVPEPPQPPENHELWARLNEPEPSEEVMTLAVGFNAPVSESTWPIILWSEEEVRASWLATALETDELEAVLAQTNFAYQVLIVMTFGRHANASGKVFLSDLVYQKMSVDLPVGYRISARLGVVDAACGIPFADSYPFFVVRADAIPDGVIVGTGYSTFPDECGPVATGEPIAAP